MKIIKSLSCIAMLCGTVCANAQDEASSLKRLSFDAHVGMNFSDYVQGSRTSDPDMKKRTLKPGLLLGVGVNVSNKKHYEFNPEVNYSQMGVKNYVVDYHHFGGSIWKPATADETLHYIEIPV